MHDRPLPLPDPDFGRQYHPEQLDLDQFAAAIRLLLAPSNQDLHSDRDRGIHVVTH
jgi:hypothetical protein